MGFTLMDTHTGNLVGTHPTRELALRAVAEAIGRYGEDAAATLALGQFERDRPGELIAQGADLAQMATASIGLKRAGKREKTGSSNAAHYVRRDEHGKVSSNQVDVGRSLAASRRQRAGTVLPKGQTTPPA